MQAHGSTLGLSGRGLAFHLRAVALDSLNGFFEGMIDTVREGWATSLVGATVSWHSSGAVTGARLGLMAFLSSIGLAAFLHCSFSAWGVFSAVSLLTRSSARVGLLLHGIFFSVARGFLSLLACVSVFVALRLSSTTLSSRLPLRRASRAALTLLSRFSGSGAGLEPLLLFGLRLGVGARDRHLFFVSAWYPIFHADAYGSWLACLVVELLLLIKLKKNQKLICLKQASG